MFLLLKYDLPHGKCYTKLTKIAPENSFEEIYNANLPESAVGRSCRKVYVGEKEQEHNEASMTEIDLKTSVSDIQDVIALQKILFFPDYNEDRVHNKTPVDAMSYLMAASIMLKFPDKKTEKNGVDKLHNFVVEYLKEKTTGFGGNQMAEMDIFMQTVTKVLWTLDGQCSKFEAAPGVLSIPRCFSEQTFRCLEHQGMVKKQIPKLNMNELITHATKLETLLSKKFMNLERFSQVKTDIEGLSASIHSYIEFLNRRSADPIFTQKSIDNVNVYVVEASNETNAIVDSIYKGLKDELENTSPYGPLNLKVYAPMDRRKRYLYIKKLKLPFDVQVYKRSGPAASFIWKLHDDKSQRTDSDFANAIKQIETVLVPALTTANRRRLAAEHKNRALWSPQLMRNVVEYLNGKNINNTQKTKK